MSQNNTLSAKAQNIVDNFIKNNSSRSKVSKTDVMKHFITTLYAQTPNAKAKLIKPFKECIFHLHDYFTQEEIDVLIAESRQVIKYCFDNSEKTYSLYDGYVFNTNDTLEDLIDEDPLITPFKTPKYLIDLSMRLSGKRKANEKVYLPYTEIADYALYNPEAEYHVEAAIGKYNNYNGTTTFFEDRYFSFSNLLLDGLGIKSDFVPVDTDFTINETYLKTRPDYVFAFNPLFNQENRSPFEYAESIWNTAEEVRPMDLASIIVSCANHTQTGGCLDFVFPTEILDSKNFWKLFGSLFTEKQMTFNAMFINLGEIDYAADSVNCFFLHIEKDKGNDGMIRFFDASSSVFHEYSDLKVDVLMDMLSKEECNAEYEKRVHYTQLSSSANPYSIDKRLPQLAPGAKYIPLGELVEVIEGKKLALDPSIVNLVTNGSLYFAHTGYKHHMLSRDYLNCDIEAKEVTKDNHFFYIHDKYVKTPCLVATIKTEKTAINKNIPIGAITIGKIKDEHEKVFIDSGIIAFKLKSNVITEAYLLRALTREYCNMQIPMLAEVEHISTKEVLESINFLNIMIAVPSLEAQERRWKKDAEEHINKTNTSLKKAEEKIVESADEFKRDIHMKKHAIGQTLGNLSNWWNALQRARKEGNGIVNDTMEIGKNNKHSVAEIYNNIQMQLEKLQTQVEHFWQADGLKAQTFSLPDFVNEYILEHQSPIFTYEFTDSTVTNNEEKMIEVSFSHKALAMVFDNIINNACSHGFENKASEKNIVKIELTTSDVFPCIIISNNGKPFCDKFTSEDVFTYGQSSKTGLSHSGIGGYEVRNLMREFHGEAEFISNPSSDFPVSYKLIFKSDVEL